MTDLPHTTTTRPRIDSAAPLRTRQKVAIAIAGVLNLANGVSVAFPTPDGEVGPPIAILILASALGVLGAILAVLALRTGRRVWIRLLAGSMVINALTAVPAFFVPDVPLPLVALATAGVLSTVVLVILMLSGPRRSR